MKKFAVVFALFLVPCLHAQELQRRTVLPPKPEPISLTQTNVAANTPIPEGMVWAPNFMDTEFQARELNSCSMCLSPITFRQAAFDKKAGAMWLSVLGLEIADTILTVSKCPPGSATCKEGNPLLGGTLTTQLGIKMPVAIGAWMYDAYMRKGDKRLRIGGYKKWWVAPVLFQAATSASIATNLAR